MKVSKNHRQVHDYLKATGFQLGLLVNYGRIGGLEWERIVLSEWITNHTQPPCLV